MLLLETTFNQIAAVLESDRPLAILSADRPDCGDQDNLERTKRLAAAARDAGCGFQVIEGRWGASGAREWLVLVVAAVNRAPHLLGHGRKWTTEFEQDLFLFRNANSPDILHIVVDGSRKGVLMGNARLESGGITFADGPSFAFGRAFQAAGWLTGMAHSKGAVVGGTL